MTCTACTAPASGVYIAGCRACQIRRIARSLPFFNAGLAGCITPEYRKTLQGAFGDEWAAGHAEVKAFAEQGKREQDA